jgi:uncharacterized protein (TIGR02271 family)
MVNTKRSTVAGVFQDESRAQQAMADLQAAGFSEEQIRYSVHKGGAGIQDALTGFGFPQGEASYYNEEFLAGRTVVTVKTRDRQQEASDLLLRNGAYNANSRMGRAEKMASRSALASEAATASPSDADQKLRLHEEQLSATKQSVQTGEVDVHKEVVTEEKSINVPVSHEEVYIERHPVSGNAALNAERPFDLSQNEEDIRVPVSAEQVQVTKQPVVTEEITLGKRVAQENQQVTDTVRHEEARIDRSGNATVQGSESVDDADRRIDQ